MNFAKQLRRDLTPAEARLWYNLRAKRFAGVKFRRQTVIGPYIADFTCRTAMLVIEVDGDTHGSAIQYDAERTAFLEQQGWRVLRFTNADVLQNLEAVLSTIAQRLPPLPDLDESHVPLIDP
ncbi:endonuclease domain-containing protein [Sphingomonadales bacterium 56]|nr:endonuclease domain-containing protein [Sphingomonadales bacterium 56]MBY2959657.1 endonuclease domain-containing protein [Sphingomonadales bacterium 58]